MQTWQDPCDIETGFDSRPMIDFNRLKPWVCPLCKAFDCNIWEWPPESEAHLTYSPAKNGGLFRDFLHLEGIYCCIFVVRGSVHGAKGLTTHVNFDALTRKVLACIAHLEDEIHFIRKPGLMVIDCSNMTIGPAPVGCQSAVVSLSGARLLSLATPMTPGSARTNSLNHTR